MNEAKASILAITPRIPGSLENKKDKRLFDILKCLAEHNNLHLLYIQSDEDEKNICAELAKCGIVAFSLKEKRKPGIYSMDLQMKEVLQAENYGAVFFNTHYTAKYYLPFIEAYLSKALVIIDVMGSQYTSVMESAGKVSNEIQRSAAFENAERYKMAEIPILSHADLVIVESENASAVIRASIPFAEVKVAGASGFVEPNNGLLSGVSKGKRKEIETVEVILMGCGPDSGGEQFETINTELLSRCRKVSIKKVSGDSFIECFNKAVSGIDADYALFVTRNTLLNERTINDLLYCASVNPEYGIIYPSSNQSIDATIDAANLKNFLPKHYASNFCNWQESKMIKGECFLLRKEIVYKIGNMDERFKTLHYALFDYSLKVFQCGHKSINMNEAFVFYSHTSKERTKDLKFDKDLLFSKWADEGIEFLEEVGEPGP